MEISGNKDEVAEVAKDTLEMLLDRMGVLASVTPLSESMMEEAPAHMMLNVEGEDLGILIGRRGQTLSCLQYIVRIIVGHKTKVWLPIVIDVEGYKQRRYNVLQTLAWRVAEQVKANGTPLALEPMSAFDRRIIHLTLAEHPDVATESSGEGEARRVVILPKEQSF
ncbi:protein jag [Chloroflexota bacterium]